MRVLVVASEAVTPDRLRSALGPEEADHAEVMVVAPALHASAVRFWMSDADEAIARADDVQRETVERLERDGVSARGDTGEGDLIEAVADALTTFPADRILLYAHPEGERRHGEQVTAKDLRERFPIPVDDGEVREPPA